MERRRGSLTRACIALSAAMIGVTGQTVRATRIVPEDVVNADHVTYYVSPHGNDDAPGTRPETAWRTLRAVNQQNLEPGTTVLLEGGARFSGSIELEPEDAGNAEHPIVFSSFGRGSAVIDAGDGTAVYAYNVGGIELAGLSLVGSGLSSNSGMGVHFYTDLPGEGRLDHIVLERLDVSGFTEGGIAIEGFNGVDYARGYDDVQITANEIHDNGDFGIATLGYWEANTRQTGYAHTNLYVAHNRVYDNPGKPGKTHNHTGDGIVISTVDGGLLEYNEAFGNGAGNVSAQGPVGIWAWESNDITFQFNESHHNSAGEGVDGDGFDFDGGVTNSLMQYNFAHDNDGAGFLVAQFGGARPTTDNVIRYNVGVNNGSANRYGGITLWTAEDEILGRHDIHNNTIYASRLETGEPSAVTVLEGQYSSVVFRNNLLIVDGLVPLVQAVDVTGVTFEHNAYWSEGGDWTFAWGEIGYDSLNGWRMGCEQEMDDGDVLGIDADPMLLGGAADALERYVPELGSPLIDAASPVGDGVAITHDFLGRPVPSGDGIDVGAFEAQVGELSQN